MKLPQVGDIVHWFGDNGPNHVLILKILSENPDIVENVYRVLPLTGEPFSDMEWVLSKINSGCWEIVA